MPPQRRARSRRTPTHSSAMANPPPQTDLPAPAPPEEPLLRLNVLDSTPSHWREISTEPATPTSPTLSTRAWALRRERSVDIPHSVLHYDRAENALQPWYWYANIRIYLRWMITFSYVLVILVAILGRSMGLVNESRRPIFSNIATRMNSLARAAFVHRSSPTGPLTRKPQSLWRCRDQLRANTPLLVPRGNVVIGVSSM